MNFPDGGKVNSIQEWPLLCIEVASTGWLIPGKDR